MSKYIRSRSCIRLSGQRRRGVALLLAIFAMVIVGTTTAAYVASRDTSMLVARNAQVAADARTLASAGMNVTEKLLRSGDSNWRTAHTNGRLLNDYSLDGGTVTVDLVDIKRRAAGEPNPVPNSATTEVEVTVTSNRAGSTWSTMAHMSIPSVLNGQYAIYVERFLNIVGGGNFIGRWVAAPMAGERLRVNLATSAKVFTVAKSGVPGTGVVVDSGTKFETALSGSTSKDPDASKPVWLYHPYDASGLIVTGSGASQVATKRMDADKAVKMVPAPSAPAMSGLYTKYGADLKLSSQTATYAPFQVKAAMLPQTFPKNLEITNNSVITLTSGTYEIWGTFKLDSSKLIIQGDVKIVVQPSTLRLGLDWKDSVIELQSNSTLEIYNYWTANIDKCWMGSQYTCASEPSALLRDGDPHRKLWFGKWQATACSTAAPRYPIYMQPWRIRVYSLATTLTTAFTYTIKDSSLIGSFYLPAQIVRLYGNSQIYGRLACRDLSMEDTASLFYDHAMDEIAGLTEGMAPARGGDPDQIFPERVIRFGFDADNAR